MNDLPQIETTTRPLAPIPWPRPGGPTRLTLYLTSSTGGRGNIRVTRIGERYDLSGGFEAFGQAEARAWKRSRLIADPLNGGDLDAARRILAAAGLEVLAERHN